MSEARPPLSTEWGCWGVIAICVICLTILIAIGKVTCCHG